MKTIFTEQVAACADDVLSHHPALMIEELRAGAAEQLVNEKVLGFGIYLNTSM
jgi:hypothetical protein